MSQSRPVAADADELRAAFEQQTVCSYDFKRSRNGNYVNPTTSLKWRWFVAGFEQGVKAMGGAS